MSHQEATAAGSSVPDPCQGGVPHWGQRICYFTAPSAVPETWVSFCNTTACDILRLTLDKSKEGFGPG